MPGEFGGRYQPEGAVEWHPGTSDYDNPQNPEKPDDRPIEHGPKKIESPDDTISSLVEKRERLLVLFAFLIRYRMFKKLIELMRLLSLDQKK